MNFRKNVETASSRIWVGIKVLEGVVINQFFVVHASGVFFYSSSYLVIHNDCTGSLVRRFEN